MVNKFNDDSTFYQSNENTFIVEKARFDLNENKEHYRDILQSAFNTNIAKVEFQNSSFDVVPVYGADGAQIQPESNTEFFSEGVVASVIVGGKTQRLEKIDPIEEFKTFNDVDKTGELAKNTMRDLEYLIIHNYFKKYNGIVIADGSSNQVLYDIPKMLESNLFFDSTTNPEILEILYQSALDGRLIFFPKKRKSCKQDSLDKCFSHIHSVLGVYNPDLHALNEREILSPLLNENEIFHSHLNGISRLNQWSSSGWSNKKIVTDNVGLDISSNFFAFKELIKNQFKGMFVKFGNNPYVQEIEYFNEDSVNIGKILKSLDIEIRGNLPQPLPILKADQIAKINVIATLNRENARKISKKGLKMFVNTRPISLRK